MIFKPCQTFFDFRRVGQLQFVLQFYYLFSFAFAALPVSIQVMFWHL